MKPQVSLIIPAYNCAKHIRHCINSILGQSFQNFELIIIDDGSSDNTLSIIKSYKDHRIKTYHQKNQGAAATRNRGIKLAKSPFIMFIDNDDFIEIDYIATYYNAITTGDYDIVMGGYTKDDKIFTPPLSGDFAPYTIVAPWARIIRTDFLKRHHIQFLQTNIGEDVYFSILIYSHQPKIHIIQNTGYHWVTNQSSISHTIQVGFNSEIHILDLLNHLKTNTKPSTLINYFYLRYIIWYLLYSGKTATPTDFLSEYHQYFAWLQQHDPHFHKNPYLSLSGPNGEDRKTAVIVWFFMKIHRCHLVPLFAKLYCRGAKHAKK